jgi:hypothetical protein
MFLSNLKPIFKFCYAKDRLVRFNDCICIHKCRLPLDFYTSLKCQNTQFNQKIGDCLCNTKCSATVNDNELDSKWFNI